MIFLCNAQNDVFTLENDSLNQGSVNANSIVLIAPYAQSATAFVRITPPNGAELEPILMSRFQGELPIKGDGGIPLGAWTVDVDAPITEFPGVITFQFALTIGSITITTSSISKTVKRGVPWKVPEASEGDFGAMAGMLSQAKTAAQNAETERGKAEDAAEIAWSALRTPGLSYRKSEDETYYVCTGIGSASAADVVIAGDIDGIPVTEIADEAFLGCDGLKHVKIPDSVEIIGKYAFDSCTDLQRVTFGCGVKRIGYAAFRFCESLKNVTIGNSVTTIELGAFAFTGLTTVLIPASVESLGAGAFFESENLTVYCEAKEKPQGWHGAWDALSGDYSFDGEILTFYEVHSRVPVVWGVPLDFAAVNEKMEEIKRTPRAQVQIIRWEDND